MKPVDLNVDPVEMIAVLEAASSYQDEGNELLGPYQSYTLEAAVRSVTRAFNAANEQAAHKE